MKIKVIISIAFLVIGCIGGVCAAFFNDDSVINNSYNSNLDSVKQLEKDLENAKYISKEYDSWIYLHYHEMDKMLHETRLTSLKREIEEASQRLKLYKSGIQFESYKSGFQTNFVLGSIESKYLNFENSKQLNILNMAIDRLNISRGEVEEILEQGFCYKCNKLSSHCTCDEKVFIPIFVGAGVTLGVFFIFFFFGEQIRKRRVLKETKRCEVCGGVLDTNGFCTDSMCVNNLFSKAKEDREKIYVCRFCGNHASRLDTHGVGDDCGCGNETKFYCHKCGLALPKGYGYCTNCIPDTIIEKTWVSTKFRLKYFNNRTEKGKIISVPSRFILISNADDDWSFVISIADLLSDNGDLNLDVSFYHVILASFEECDVGFEVEAMYRGLSIDGVELERGQKVLAKVGSKISFVLKMFEYESPHWVIEVVKN